MPDATATSPLTPILTPIFQALATALAGLVVAVAVKMLQKLNLSVDADQQAKLEYVAKQQILKAEEEAAAKYQLDQKFTSGAAKLQTATAGVIAKLPNVTQQEAEDAVHAALPQLALGATTLAGKVGEAVVTRP